MEIKKHTAKEQARFIVDAIAYVIRNWKSIVAVWGTIAALVGLLGTFAMNRVLIPSAKPLVRPIIREYTNHYQVQIDSLYRLIDSLQEKTRKLKGDIDLFHRAD